MPETNKKIGKIIAFEGVDRSGKTTTIKTMEKSLIEKGHKVDVIRALGAGNLGTLIRGYYLSDASTQSGNLEKSLLLLAAFVECNRRVIDSALQGNIVLLDRFYPSYYVYNCDLLNTNNNPVVKTLFNNLFNDKSLNTTPELLYIHQTMEENLHYMLGEETGKKLDLNAELFISNALFVVPDCYVLCDALTFTIKCRIQMNEDGEQNHIDDTVNKDILYTQGLYYQYFNTNKQVPSYILPSSDNYVVPEGVEIPLINQEQLEDIILS